MAVPTITSVSPSSGPEAGGTPIHIIGTNFTGVTAVTIGGTAASMYSVTNATNILAVTPAGTGTGDVVVTTAGGTATETDGFTYTPTYTTTTKVKSRFEDIDTDLTDTQINEFINCAEGIIDSVMKKTGRGAGADYTFSATKHGLIEDTASALAAFSCLTYQPTGESEAITSARASLMGDFLWAIARRNLMLLGDDRIIKHLIGL